MRESSVLIHLNLHKTMKIDIEFNKKLGHLRSKKVIH